MTLSLWQRVVRLAAAKAGLLTMEAKELCGRGLKEVCEESASARTAYGFLCRYQPDP